MAERSADEDVAEITSWLIGSARLSAPPLALIEGFCRRLLALGVPLWRLRAGQAIAWPASPTSVFASVLICGQ
jgi:hypothetical protein